MLKHLVCLILSQIPNLMFLEGYYDKTKYKDDIPSVLIFKLFADLVMPKITVEGGGSPKRIFFKKSVSSTI